MFLDIDRYGSAYELPFWYSVVREFHQLIIHRVKSIFDQVWMLSFIFSDCSLAFALYRGLHKGASFLSAVTFFVCISHVRLISKLNSSNLFHFITWNFYGPYKFQCSHTSNWSTWHYANHLARCQEDGQERNRLPLPPAAQLTYSRRQPEVCRTDCKTPIFSHKHGDYFPRAQVLYLMLYKMPSPALKSQ